jgi:hypothetical protein
MNNRGQVFFFTLMFGVILLLFALAVAQPYREITDDARTELDCSNDTISDYDKNTCLITDINLPMFVGFLIFLAIAVIGGIIAIRRSQ